MYYPRSKRAVLQVLPIKNGNPLHPKYKIDLNEDKEIIGKGHVNMLFFRNGPIKEMDFIMKPSDYVSTQLQKAGEKMLQGYDQGTFVGYNKDGSYDEFIADSMAVFTTDHEGSKLKVRLDDPES